MVGLMDENGPADLLAAEGNRVAFAPLARTDGELASDPIRVSWIIDGSPQARTKRLATASDGQSFTALWDCSAGRFTWHFGSDETVYILDGEVNVTCPSGTNRTLRPGDVAYFPAGIVSEWHVASYVKKLAFVRHRPSLARQIATRVPFARAIVKFARRVRA